MREPATRIIRIEYTNSRGEIYVEDTGAPGQNVLLYFSFLETRSKRRSHIKFHFDNGKEVFSKSVSHKVFISPLEKADYLATKIFPICMKQIEWGVLTKAIIKVS